MSYSYTNSETQTFTLTHAKYLASKVAADLKRIQRFYNLPSDGDISAYETEITEYLKKGYLKEVTYGFKLNGNWIEPTLKYTAKDLAGAAGTDDDPGKVRPGANIAGATFGSYLVQSDAYERLTTSEQQAFSGPLPVSRSGAATPGISGYMTSDRSYSSGGRSLDRLSLKSY
jgi:hypothetical protein